MGQQQTGAIEQRGDVTARIRDVTTATCANVGAGADITEAGRGGR